MTAAILATAFGLAVAGAPGQTAAAADEVDTRAELEMLEAALDRAVRQVSRASGASLLGGAEACRSYHLKGFGAMFVLAPRALPGGADVVVRRFHLSGRMAASPAELDPPPAGHTAESRRRRPMPRGSTEEDARRARELQAMEEQVEAFQREAEAARRQAERALEAVARQMRAQLEVAAPDVAAPEVPPPAPAPPAPPAPAMPVAPSARPAPAPPLPEIPMPPMGAFPPLPPWRSWFSGEDIEDDRTPERVVLDVRTAVSQALAVHGGRVRVLRPDEFVVVAVDFVPPWPMVDQPRPQRTLVVRVRKKELEERLAGRLSPDDLQKRIEYEEY
jgi:hypothetical protein